MILINLKWKEMFQYLFQCNGHEDSILNEVLSNIMVFIYVCIIMIIKTNIGVDKNYFPDRYIAFYIVKYNVLLKNSLASDVCFFQINIVVLE